MNQYLVDRTREHLIGAAAFVREKVNGDATIQILAAEEHVIVRGCSGGKHKTWLSTTVDWDDVATAKDNPILPAITGVLFRMERYQPGDPTQA